MALSMQMVSLFKPTHRKNLRELKKEQYEIEMQYYHHELTVKKGSSYNLSMASPTSNIAMQPCTNHCSQLLTVTLSCTTYMSVATAKILPSVVTKCAASIVYAVHYHYR